MNNWRALTSTRDRPISRANLARPFRSSVLIGATLLFSQPLALAQFVQQGPKLPGSGHAGYAVALSASGDTAIVGGPTDNGNAGAAWIYTRSNNTWMQQAQLPIGSGAVGGARQGSSVALSADGNTAIVGGPFDNSQTGAAWVYVRKDGGWSQQGDKLVGSDAYTYSPLGPPGTSQAGSVALSADGNTAIVGDPFDTRCMNNINGFAMYCIAPGAAYVFTRSDGVWTQQQKLAISISLATGSINLGTAVALSADGNTAIITESENTNWVWTRANGVWTQSGTLPGNPGRYWVGLSGDGMTAMAGGYTPTVETAYGNNGEVWVYTRNGNAWTPQDNLVASNAGFSAVTFALSGDGNTAIVGGFNNSSMAGETWVYTRNGDIWSAGNLFPFGSGASGTMQQSDAVALSPDASTAIVGVPSDNGGAGAAWIYIEPTVKLTTNSPIVIDQNPALNWSTTNANSCTAGGWSADGAWSGSKSPGPHQAQQLPLLPAVSTYQFTLTCNAAPGPGVTATAYVTANAVPHITHAPPCNLPCWNRFMGNGAAISPYGQVSLGQSGTSLLTKSGTIEAIVVTREGNRDINTIVVSPDSTVIVSGELGDTIRLFRFKLDPTKFLDGLRDGAFGGEPWTKSAAGPPGAKPNIVGAAFLDGKLSGLMVAGDSAAR
jgi:hypothetical protein